MLLAAIMAFTHAHSIIVPGKSNPTFPEHRPFNPNQQKPWVKSAPQVSSHFRSFINWKNNVTFFYYLIVCNSNY